MQTNNPFSQGLLCVWPLVIWHNFREQNLLDSYDLSFKLHLICITKTEN